MVLIESVLRLQFIYALSILVIIALTIFAWSRNRRVCTIDGPKGNPFIGIGLSLPPQAPQVLAKWAKQYGNVFKIHVGWHDWVVVNDPDAMKVIFDKESVHTSSKVPLPYGHDLVSHGRRMFTMRYGSRWRTYRTIVHKLLSIQETQLFIPSQEFEVKQLLFELGNMNDNQTDFYFHVRRMSMSIISTSTLGRRINNKGHEDIRKSGESSKLLGEITRAGVFIEDEIPLLLKLPRWLQPSYRKATKYADVLLEVKMHIWNRLKKDADAGTIAPCFGTELLKSNYQDQGLTEEDAAWIVGGLVEAGSETTSVTLLNLVLYLTAYPAVQKRAYEELLDVVGSKRAPTYNDISKLPYIRACIKEILRLNPVPLLGIKHYTDSDIKYKDHLIPAGTALLANTAFLHRDPARFSNPDAFQPERYLAHTRSSADYAAVSDPYARDHFTFGAGRRICPGIRLAENTLHLTIANLLWAYELRPPLVKGVDGQIGEGVMDLSDDAFLVNAAFRPPKVFAARFVPRTNEAMEIINRGWEMVKESGYVLRGVKIEP